MNLIELIFSTDFLYMWIRVATPILLASLGAVICTKAGVVNLGLEGIMLISALAGVLGSAFGGSLWIGLLTGLLASVAVSAVFAYFHLVLKANNVLCGTAVNTMASGVCTAAGYRRKGKFLFTEKLLLPKCGYPHY